jgi:hypothetical protein
MAVTETRFESDVSNIGQVNEPDLATTKNTLRNAETLEDLVYAALGLVATLSWHAGPGGTADLDGARAVGDVLLTELKQRGAGDILPGWLNSPCPRP